MAVKFHAYQATTPLVIIKSVAQDGQLDSDNSAISRQIETWAQTSMLTGRQSKRCTIASKRVDVCTVYK